MADRSPKHILARIWPLAILVLILIATHSQVFFLGRTLVPRFPSSWIPSDYQGPSTGSEIYIDPAGSLNVNTSFDEYTARTIRQGSLPFWNPYQGLGQPFLANGLSEVLYPPNWLNLLLPPAWRDLTYFLNWLLASLFFYLYLRLIGFEVDLALLGGAAILVSGHFRIYLALREVPANSAWFPLLLYAVERTLQDPSWRGRYCVLPLGIFCSVTAGQPQVTFLGFSFLLIYALIRLALLKEQRIQALLTLALGSVGGLLLSAPFWVNFSAYAFGAFSKHMGGSGPGLSHLGTNYLSLYLFPYLYGLIHDHPLGKVPGIVWDFIPGWMPALVVFAALASLGELWRKPDKSLVFFTFLALFMAAKFAGVPVINHLGSLPLLERIHYLRFTPYLLTFGLAGMAVYGIRRLACLEPQRWLPWLAVWTLSAVGLLALGLRAVWPNLKAAGWGSIPMIKVSVFAALGLAWALAAPLALYWVRRRHPEDQRLFYLIAALGILLQGMAYLPHGFSYGVSYLLIALCLAVFLVSVTVVSSPGRTYKPAVLMVCGLVVLALPPLVFSLTSTHGLPKRYNPLTCPAYLEKLLALQNKGLFRSYSFDAVPPANFGTPFALSSLSNVEALAPMEAALFSHNYLDRGTPVIWLGGNLTPGRDPRFDAASELVTNLRYYSLIAVKYLAGRENEPLNVPFHWLDPFRSATSMIPVSLATPLHMKIVCTEETLARVDVFLSTHNKKNQGMVSLQILAPDGALLAAAQSPAEKLQENSFHKFVFPALQGLKGREIILRLRFTPTAPNSQVSAWVSPEEPKLGFACRLFRQADTPRNFPLVYEDPKTGVRIWENPGALPRLFLAPEARVVSTGEEALHRLKDTSDLSRQVWITEGPGLTSSWPQQEETGRVLSFRVDPNEVLGTFKAHTPGILTLTDSFSPGWRAALNGREVPVLEVDGVFRGVRVTAPGTYDVRFWYRPPYWTLSLALAGLGVLLIAGANFLGVRGQGSGVSEQ